MATEKPITSDIPLLDMAEPPLVLAPKAAAACRDHGLFQLRGHGLEAGTLERLAALSRDFFDLEAAEKDRVVQPAADCIRGYIGLGKAALEAADGKAGRGAVDQKESFNMGPVEPRRPPAKMAPALSAAHCAGNLWPAAPAGFRAAWEDAYRRFEALSVDVFALLARAMGLPENQFEKAADCHVSVLGAIHYPTLSGDAAPRAGAHRDFGAFTLLWLEPERPGLEVMGKDGRWSSVAGQEGCLLVLLADMMALWTNGRWRAPIHRVAGDPAGAWGASGRLTLGYFQHPNLDAEVHPLVPFRTNGEVVCPLLAGEHLYRQFARQQAAAEDVGLESESQAGGLSNCGEFLDNGP